MNIVAIWINPIQHAIKYRQGHVYMGLLGQIAHNVTGDEDDCQLVDVELGQELAILDGGHVHGNIPDMEDRIGGEIEVSGDLVQYHDLSLVTVCCKYSK